MAPPVMSDSRSDTVLANRNAKIGIYFGLGFVLLGVTLFFVMTQVENSILYMMPMMITSIGLIAVVAFCIYKSVLHSRIEYYRAVESLRQNRAELSRFHTREDLVDLSMPTMAVFIIPLDTSDSQLRNVPDLPSYDHIMGEVGTILPGYSEVTSASETPAECTPPDFPPAYKQRFIDGDGDSISTDDSVTLPTYEAITKHCDQQL